MFTTSQYNYRLLVRVRVHINLFLYSSVFAFSVIPVSVQLPSEPLLLTITPNQQQLIKPSSLNHQCNFAKKFRILHCSKRWHFWCPPWSVLSCQSDDHFKADAGTVMILSYNVCYHTWCCRQSKRMKATDMFGESNTDTLSH